MDVIRLGKAQLNDMNEDAEIGSYYTTKDTLYINCYLSSAEEILLYNQIGDAGVRLYNHYALVLSQNNRSKQGRRTLLTDKNAARMLGWDISKVARIRRGLQKLGWFYFTTYTTNTGTRGIDYYLGLERVTTQREREQRQLKAKPTK